MRHSVTTAARPPPGPQAGARVGTVGRVTRDALTFAALASAAVPGLSPISAEAVRPRPGERFRVGFVEDAEHRRWVVRLPVDAVAAAQQDASVALLGMLARRVPFSVPSPKGFVGLRDGRRAMVYPLISGHSLVLYTVPAGTGLAAEVGRTVAHLHNVDRRLFEEAALPAYDAAECRRRHLIDVDRGAHTGLVPAGLLSRWERMLDDVSWWRFAPTPIHGRLDGNHLLVAFSSEEDAASGRIRAIVGWEDAKVGDPAEDFAALIAAAAPDTIDTVLEAYVMSRLENPDPYLEKRARLIAELRLVTDLLAAVAAKDDATRDAAVRALRRLNADVGDPEARTEEPGGQAVSFVYEQGPSPDRLYQAGDVPSPNEASPPVADGSPPVAAAEKSPPATDASPSIPDASPPVADADRSPPVTDASPPAASPPVADASAVDARAGSHEPGPSARPRAVRFDDE